MPTEYVAVVLLHQAAGMEIRYGLDGTGFEFR
jgi:hypothetical protein